MTPDEKQWIDEASYYELLEKWRFEALGSPYFQNTEISDYFSLSMNEKKKDVDHVAISKQLGW